MVQPTANPSRRERRECSVRGDARAGCGRRRPRLTSATGPSTAGAHRRITPGNLGCTGPKATCCFRERAGPASREPDYTGGSGAAGPHERSARRHRRPGRGVFYYFNEATTRRSRALPSRGHGLVRGHRAAFTARPWTSCGGSLEGRSAVHVPIPATAGRSLSAEPMDRSGSTEEAACGACRARGAARPLLQSRSPRSALAPCCSRGPRAPLAAQPPRRSRRRVHTTHLLPTAGLAQAHQHPLSDALCAIAGQPWAARARVTFGPAHPPGGGAPGPPASPCSCVALSVEALVRARMRSSEWPRPPGSWQRPRRWSSRGRRAGAPSAFRAAGGCAPPPRRLPYARSRAGSRRTPRPRSARPRRSRAGSR